MERAKRPLLRLFPVLLLNLTAFGIAIPIIPALAKELGGEGTAVGAIFALQALGQMLMAPVWGKLSDRAGRRAVLMATICGAAAIDVVTALAGQLWVLMAVRFVAGLLAGNVATASALVSDATDEGSRSKGMALIGICFGLGFTLGPGLGALASFVAPDDPGLLGRGFPFLVSGVLNVVAAGLA
ncbi:MAG: MFS transporter, partial [Myxococcota bacterium]